MEACFNDSTKKYEIIDFDESLIKIQEFIEKNSLENLLIQNDSDKKAVKNARTIIRAKKNELKNLRIKANESMLGKFNEQVFTIEKMLDNCDLKMKENLDNYEKKLAKPTKFTITISSYSKESIDKIKAFALQLGNVEVK